MLNLILDKRNEKDPIIYPYFFLNPERVGITGMITWILALLAGFIVMGYIIMIIDHLLGKMLKELVSFWCQMLRNRINKGYTVIVLLSAYHFDPENG